MTGDRTNARLLTPNQIVAWNLKLAREAYGWTQEQAAKRLEPFLGVRWSKATFSNAERTIGQRIKKFDADEIWALARTFKTGVCRFFIPPEQFHGRRVRVNTEQGRAEMLSFSDAFDIARPGSPPEPRNESERMQQAVESAKIIFGVAEILANHRPDIISEGQDRPFSVREKLDVQTLINSLYPDALVRNQQTSSEKKRPRAKRKLKKRSKKNALSAR